MKQFLLITVVFIINSIIVCGQQTTVVTGNIKDTSNMQQLNGATISLVNTKDSSLLSFVRTDSSGNFIFNKVPKGKYRLSATHTGFHTTWRTCFGVMIIFLIAAISTYILPNYAVI